MRPPGCVRQLADDERTAVEKGLRSTDAGVVRRCPMLVARACGPMLVARARGPRSWRACPTDRRAAGLRRPGGARRAARLHRRGTRPPARDEGLACPADPPGLRTRLVCGPAWSADPNKPSASARACPAARAPWANRPASGRWPGRREALAGAAAGRVPTWVSGETSRQTLRRLGIGWKRATHGSTRPDLAYEQKQGSATA